LALRKRFEKELAEHRVEDRIHIREENTEAELDILYSTARCFIRWSNPSVVETGPSYGLIQAISNGCVPVISMDLGSSPRVAEKLGPEFAVDNTVAGFADAIRRLFNDEEFFAKAVQNVINWRNSYTGKEYGERLLSIIHGQS
jgi:glycosyltransferase involved in cell wall biosynthesis